MEYKKCLKKVVYCIGGGDTWDLPEFNFISMFRKKNLITPWSYNRFFLIFCHNRLRLWLAIDFVNELTQITHLWIILRCVVQKLCLEKKLYKPWSIANLRYFKIFLIIIIPYYSQLIESVVNVAYSIEVEICLLSNKILLKILQKFRSLNETVLIRILDLCKYFTMSLDVELKEQYTKLFCFIPINISASRVQNISVLNKQDFSVFAMLARNSYVQASEENVLSVNSFKAIMGYMLAGLNQGDLYSKTWLERLFYVSQQKSQDDKKQTPKDTISMESVIDGNEGKIYFFTNIFFYLW